MKTFNDLFPQGDNIHHHSTQLDTKRIHNVHKMLTMPTLHHIDRCYGKGMAIALARTR